MWHGCFTASATDLAAGWLLSDSQKTLSTWWHSDITWRSSLAANDASKCFTFGCFLSCDSASSSLADVGSCAVEGQASRAVSHSQEQWRSLHGESVASAVALCKVHTTWHCSHLLLCAVLLRRPTAAAIDRYLLPARLTAANPPPPQRHAVVDRRDRETDRRTDTVPLHRSWHILFKHCQSYGWVIYQKLKIEDVWTIQDLVTF